MEFVNNIRSVNFNFYQKKGNNTYGLTAALRLKNHYSNLYRAVIFLFIVFISNTIQAQSLLSKTIDFDLENSPIAEALIDLCEAADINIAFHPRLFPKTQKISGHYKNKSIEYILKDLLSSTKITFKLEGLHLILYQKPTQQFIISGYIEDAQTGERLVAATIYEAISGKGATTNDYGFFSIKIPEGSVELHYSYLGYQETIQPFDLKKKQSLKIGLKPSITLQEVIVTADNYDKNQAQVTLGKGQNLNLQNLATTISLAGEPDLMRYMSTQAGVQSGADGFGGVHVRGGNADQNLVLLDGVPIYNPSHTLGLFSIFNTHIVKSVNLVKDGFSAKYGGRLSSVIDVRVKEGSTKEWQGEGEIGTLATKLIIEGPIKKEQTGLLIAMRRTHLDPFISNYTATKKFNNGYDGHSDYYFFDLNAKIHHRFSTKDQLFFSYYIGKDEFRDEQTYEYDDGDFEYEFEDQQQKIEWGNQIAALRWNHLFGEQLFSNTTLTFSQYDYNSLNIFYDYYELDTKILENDYLYTTFQSKIRDAGLKIDFEYYPNSNHQFLFGIGALYRGFKSGELEFLLDETTAETDLEAADEIINEIYELPLFKATELDFYIEDRVKVTNKISLLAGLHLAAFITNQKTYFIPQPRFNFRWNFRPNWTTTFSGSTMSQFLHILSTTGSSLPNDLWVPSTQNVRPQTAWQLTWALTHQSDKGWKSSTDIFYKKQNHLITYESGADLPGLLEFDPTFWEAEITSGNGKSYGWSTTLEKNKGTLTGQINYAYTISERQFEGLNDNQPFPFRFTHPHEIKIGLNYQLTPTIAFNINGQYGSGQPISLIKSNSRFAPLNNFGSNDLERVGTINSYRLPAYHRLDLGFYFQWIQPKIKHHLNLGVYNLYNRKNPYYVYQYEDIDFPEDSGLRQQNALPLLPSIAYRVVF